MAASPKVHEIPTVISGQQHLIVGQQPLSTSSNNPRNMRHKKALRGLGIAEVALGGLSILLAIAANSIAGNEASNYRRRNSYGYYSYYYYYVNVTFTYVSQGIWCGVFMIVIGSLGISVISKPSKCMYIANMTMAIIAACIAFAGTVMSGIAAGTSYYSVSLIAIHSIITVLCFAGMIITIVHSAFCCRGVCCRSSSVSTPQIMYYPQQVMAQPQCVQGPNGQMLMAVNQVVPTQFASQSPLAQPSSSISYPVGTQISKTDIQNPRIVCENGQEKAPPTYNA